MLDHEIIFTISNFYIQSLVHLNLNYGDIIFKTSHMNIILIRVHIR